MASDARKARADVETRLLEMVRAGDPSALEPLMALYSSRVYRVARGICRSDADAEEVTQDVFLTLFQKADRFDGKSSFWSWLFRVTTNKALMKRRGKRFEAEVPLDAHLPSWEADGSRAGDRSMVLCDWSQNPEDDLLSGETRAALERAIDALPPGYRAVLILRDVQGLTNEEVAETIGESIACVKSRLHRARMAVREQVTRVVGAAQ